jgi:hypothetical protein
MVGSSLEKLRHVGGNFFGSHAIDSYVSNIAPARSQHRQQNCRRNDQQSTRKLSHNESSLTFRNDSSTVRRIFKDMERCRGPGTEKPARSGLLNN